MNWETVLELLQELERRIPPPSGVHHTLAAKHYGNEEKSEPKLTLSIFQAHSVQEFFIDPDDTRQEIIDYVVEHVQKEQTCDRCKGSGAICDRCSEPSTDCTCSDHVLVLTVDEQCPQCKGKGTC